MKIRLSRRFIYVSSAILTVFVIFLILPLHYSFSLGYKGIIQPGSEWILFKGQEDRLNSIFLDHKDANPKQYSSILFERGDNFILNRGIKAGEKVEAGDTIAEIRSLSSREEITGLKGRISELKAQLKVVSSGEKTAIIDEARKNIEYYSKLAAEQKKIAERKKALFDADLISFEEYDVAKGEFESDSINAEVAKEQYKAAATGSKLEEIEYIRAQLQSADDMLEVFREKSSSLIIKSPVSGIVKNNFSLDTLLIVAQTGKCIINLPVPAKDRKYIKTGSRVTVTDPVTGAEAVGSVCRTSSELSLYNEKPFFLAVVEFENNGHLCGHLADCSISTGKYSSFQYLTAIIESFLNN